MGTTFCCRNLDMIALFFITLLLSLMDRKSSAWAITPLAKPLQSSDISERDLSTLKGAGNQTVMGRILCFLNFWMNCYHGIHIILSGISEVINAFNYIRMLPKYALYITLGHLYLRKMWMWWKPIMFRAKSRYLRLRCL